MKLLCSVNVNQPCAADATDLLIIRIPGSTPAFFPRCAGHPALSFVRLSRKLNPDAHAWIVPLDQMVSVPFPDIVP